jgi:multidrug resistance efflux pump
MSAGQLSSDALVYEPEPGPATSCEDGAAPALTTMPVADAASSLFRHQALEAYQRGAALSSPLQVVPLTSRAVLGAVALLLGSALGIVCFGQVDITSRGRGVIRARDGVQPLLFETGGSVRELLVETGQLVRTGQPIARLDSTSLRATLQQAEAELEAVRAHAAREDRQEQIEQERSRALLEQRRALALHMIDSQEASAGELSTERSRYAALLKEGLVGAQAAIDNEQLLAERRRGVLSLQDAVAQLDQQRVALERNRLANQSERAQALRQAEAQRDAAKVMLEQTELVAPQDGRVESIMVAKGQVIQSGTVVARLVNLATPLRVTAFLPERDRAFVAAGTQVRIELDELPYGEFGGAGARVTRVSADTASAEEMAQVLGAAAPLGVQFRIELDLDEDPNSERLTSRVGSGSLLEVRLPLRKRRVLDLIFAPVRKLLDG